MNVRKHQRGIHIKELLIFTDGFIVGNLIYFHNLSVSIFKILIYIITDEKFIAKFEN